MTDSVFLPVSRVGGDPPQELDRAKVRNIYVFNALLSLAGEAAETDELVGLGLVDLSLKEGLKNHFLPQPDEGRGRAVPQGHFEVRCARVWPTALLVSFKPGPGWCCPAGFVRVGVGGGGLRGAREKR